MRTVLVLVFYVGAVLYSFNPRFQLGSSVCILWFSAELYSVAVTSVCLLLSFSHVYALMTTWIPKLSADCILFLLSCMFWDSALFPILHVIRMSLLFYLQYTLDALCTTQLSLLTHFFLSVSSPLLFYVFSYSVMSISSHVLYSSHYMMGVLLPFIILCTSVMLLLFLWRIWGHQLTLSTMLFLSLFQYAMLMSVFVWGVVECELWRSFMSYYVMSCGIFVLLAIVQSSILGRWCECLLLFMMAIVACGLPPSRLGLVKWKMMSSVHNGRGCVVLGVGLSWLVVVMQVLLFVVPLVVVWGIGACMGGSKVM